MKFFPWAILVAILGLILYPGCTPAYVICHTNNCLTHIKQLATAHRIYLADNNDRFPLRDDWMDGLEQYTKNPWLNKCPTSDMTKNPQAYGYCFNAKLSGAKEPANPDKVELVFDSINLARNASGALESLPRPGRHNGKNNIAYADGHAKAVANP